MAVLSAADRLAVRKMITDFICDNRESVAVTKAQLQAAINGLDDYVDTNATAINQAIPNGARTNLTTKQKAFCLGYVCMKRAGVL